MAIWSPSSILLRVFLILALTTAALHAVHVDIGVHWGQHGSNEGSIADYCKNGNFEYLYIDVLDHFGNFQTPKLNINQHCNPEVSGCTYLGNEIKQCQEKGVKVLLSIGGNRTENYTLVSTEDAWNLATFLWDNFLGGSSISRPFGDAVLDGINFDIKGRTSSYWKELAAFLKAHCKGGKEVYLSATSQYCEFPDPWLGKALGTTFFNYVSPTFYGSPACNISQKWSKWTTIPVPKLFLGLNADSLEPEYVCHKILPTVNQSNKFAGITLWGSGLDEILKYAAAVRSCLSEPSPFLVLSYM